MKASSDLDHKIRERVAPSIQRTVTIGLVFAVLGIIGSILIDRFASGTSLTVLTSALFVVLLAGALALHHVAVGVEHELEHQIDR